MIKRFFRNIPTAAVAVVVLGLAIADGAYGLTARGILAIAIWWAIVLGLGLGLLPLRRPRREAYIAGGLLAGLAMLAALSIAWSLSPERAFVEFNRISLYLGILLVGVLAGTPDNVTRWADGLGVGIAAVGLLALASRLFPALLLVDERVARITEGQLAYPFGYWNALGVMLALGLPLLLRTAVAARTLAARAMAVASIPALGAALFLTTSRGAVGAALLGILALLVLARPRAAAVWAVGCAAVGSAVLITALTAREGLIDPTGAPTALVAAQGRSFAGIGLATCGAVATVYAGGLAAAGARRLSPPRLPGHRRAHLALGAVAVAVAVAGAVAAIDPARALEDFEQPGVERSRQGGSSALASGTGGGRYQFWTAAVKEFESYPVLGGGAGSYQSWWAANPRLRYFVRDAHSLYLETLGELGLAGLTLLIGALGCGIVTAIRRVRGWRTGGERVTVAALSATLLAWAFAAALDWMWEMPLVTGTAILCLGLLVGPATALEPSASTRTGQPTAHARRRRRSFTVRVAVIAAACLLVLAQGTVLFSELRLEESRQAAARGNLDAAAENAREARKLQAWAATPYRQLALIERDRGEPATAQRYIDAAIERDPANHELWQIAAWIEADAGNLGEARRRLERSRSLNPILADTAKVSG